MNKNDNLRPLLFRLAAVGTLILIAAVMLVIGRGHIVYLDNYPLEYGGQTYSCPYKVAFSGGEQSSGKLYAKERGEVVCIGQTLRLDLQITEAKGGEETSRRVSVKLPYGMDSLIVNLPGLLAGLPEDAMITEFVQAAPAKEDTEEIPSGDEFLDMGDL